MIWLYKLIDKNKFMSLYIEKLHLNEGWNELRDFSDLRNLKLNRDVFDNAKYFRKQVQELSL